MKKQTTQPTWSQRIAALESKIEAANAQIQNLQTDREKLFLPASEGDTSAKAKLEDLSRQQLHVETDRHNLAIGLQQAREALAEEQRLEALTAAEERRRIIAVAAELRREIGVRVDQAMANLSGTLAELRAIGSELTGLCPDQVSFRKNREEGSILRAAAFHGLRAYLELRHVDPASMAPIEQTERSAIDALTNQAASQAQVA